MGIFGLFIGSLVGIFWNIWVLRSQQICISETVLRRAKRSSIWDSTAFLIEPSESANVFTTVCTTVNSPSCVYRKLSEKMFRTSFLYLMDVGMPPRPLCLVILYDHNIYNITMLLLVIPYIILVLVLFIVCITPNSDTM